MNRLSQTTPDLWCETPEKTFHGHPGAGVRACTDTRRQVQTIEGFEAYSLTSDHVQITVVPELGGRIVSLKDLRTRREWLWHPVDGLKLFHNQSGDRFENSPLAGIDECFPTIAPCSWRGRNLPDHGEIWSTPGEFDFSAWEEDLIKTTVRLKVSPFEFSRTVELRSNEIRLNYFLQNLATSEELYLWALHPLLRLQNGDELELPASTRALFNGVDWLDALSSSEPNGGCEKLFASKIREGRAGIHNPKTGDRLQFGWNPEQNDTLGLWLSRGGWHGHHHFALEPCNGEPDALASAAQSKRCGVIAPNASATWRVCIRVGT
jgi:galactose mutarotase-like enzyme